MKGNRNENYVARICRKGEIGLNNYFALTAASIYIYILLFETTGNENYGSPCELV